MLNYLNTLWVRTLDYAWGISDFFYRDKFLVPFLATLVASLTILSVNNLNERSRRTSKKVYAATYIAESLRRALHSYLILKVDTIIPHLQAVDKVLDGDARILRALIENDEVEILQGKNFTFPSLPEDYKVLLGIDDVTIIQMWDTFRYLQETADAKGPFASEEMRSFDIFMSLSQQRREQILRSRRDRLERSLHEADRIIHLVRLFYPKIKQYMSGIAFFFRAKKSFHHISVQIEQILEEYADLLPPADILEQRRCSGIKRAL